MDKNVDQCSVVECTAAHPRLNKSPEEEEKSMYVFFCMEASIIIGREIQCLPYAGFVWYQCYYPHRSRYALSPVCGIFIKLLAPTQTKET